MKNFDDAQPAGLVVYVKRNDFGRALSKFKKMVQDDGILQAAKARMYYEKPSQKRKREKAAGRARWLKRLRRRSDELGF